MRRRSKARIWALQIFYAHEITKAPLIATFESFFGSFYTGQAVSEEKKAYTKRLVDSYDGNKDKIDNMIEESVSNWRMERLSIIDKNILRISICELLLLPDIPGKVSINEAVNLSHLFGGDDSPRFVNGVLDAILHQTSRTD
jgi:N utilization substance protein B